MDLDLSTSSTVLMDPISPVITIDTASSPSSITVGSPVLFPSPSKEIAVLKKQLQQEKSRRDIVIRSVGGRMMMGCNASATTRSFSVEKMEDLSRKVGDLSNQLIKSKEEVAFLRRALANSEKKCKSLDRLLVNERAEKEEALRGEEELERRLQMVEMSCGGRVKGLRDMLSVAKQSVEKQDMLRLDAERRLAEANRLVKTLEEKLEVQGRIKDGEIAGLKQSAEELIAERMKQDDVIKNLQEVVDFHRQQVEDMTEEYHAEQLRHAHELEMLTMEQKNERRLHKNELEAAAAAAMKYLDMYCPGSSNNNNKCNNGINNDCHRENPYNDPSPMGKEERRKYILKEKELEDQLLQSQHQVHRLTQQTDILMMQKSAILEENRKLKVELREVQCRSEGEQHRRKLVVAATAQKSGEIRQLQSTLESVQKQLVQLSSDAASREQALLREINTLHSNWEAAKFLRQQTEGQLTVLNQELELLSNFSEDKWQQLEDKLLAMIFNNKYNSNNTSNSNNNNENNNNNNANDDEQQCETVDRDIMDINASMIVEAIYKLRRNIHAQHVQLISQATASRIEANVIGESLVRAAEDRNAQYRIHQVELENQTKILKSVLI